MKLVSGNERLIMMEMAQDLVRLPKVGKIHGGKELCYRTKRCLISFGGAMVT